MVSGYIYRSAPALKSEDSPHRPSARPARPSAAFGGGSWYYHLFRQDPAQARRTLYRAYMNEGRSIRGAAARLGCSRNTVRALLRRRDKDGRIIWGKRPLLPRRPCRTTKTSPG